MDGKREKETNEMAQMLNYKEEINIDEIRKIIKKMKKKQQERIKYQIRRGYMAKK